MDARDYSIASAPSAFGQKTCPPTDAIEKLTEFDLIDRGIADVAVTFYPDETLLRHLDSDKLERYSFAPLPDILCPIRMNRNNPLASSDRFFEVPKRNWPVIEARSAALASATNALFGSLTAAGAPVARINVRSVAAINNLLETEIDYLHVLFGGVAPLLSVHDEERGIVTRTFDDLPIRVTPYAIIRKDNPNPSAHRLMKSLAS